MCRACAARAGLSLLPSVSPIVCAWARASPTCALVPSRTHVLNTVPRAAVEDLWEAFNDVAEGFGIDVDELKEIFVILQEPLDMAKKPLASLTDALFKAFDTDEVRRRRAAPAVAWACGSQRARGVATAVRTLAVPR